MGSTFSFGKLMGKDCQRAELLIFYLLKHIDIVIIVLILVLILIVELNISLGDIGLEHFIRTGTDDCPLILGHIEIPFPNFGIPVADTDIVAFALEHSGDLPKHLPTVLAGVRPTQNGVQRALINDNIKSLILEVILHIPDITAHI